MKEISREELYNILKLHEMYLNNEDGGVRASLQDADLRCANLRYADLRDADLQRAYLRDADLQGADLRDADLQGADLRDADLQRADLQGADLQGADLDYSCLPLWCGSLTAHSDDKQLIQITYHLVKVICI